MSLLSYFINFSEGYTICKRIGTHIKKISSLTVNDKFFWMHMITRKGQQKHNCQSNNYIYTMPADVNSVLSLSNHNCSSRTPLAT